MDKTKTAEQARGGDIDFRYQRSIVVTEIAIAFPVAVALWLAAYYGLPPICGHGGDAGATGLRAQVLLHRYPFLLSYRDRSRRARKTAVASDRSAVGLRNATDEGQSSLSPEYAGTINVVHSRPARTGRLLF